MEVFYRKKYLNLIKQFLNQDKLVLLIGPRQVGKTTIMKVLFDELEIDNKTFLNLEEIQYLSTDLIEFSNFLKFEYGFDISKEGYLFLDEIQTLSDPEIFIKALYDSDKVKTKLIISGSRFWGQKKVGSSLIGRGNLINIWPFDFEEFLEIKGKKLIEVNRNLIKNYVEEYLIFGGYPKVVLSPTKKQKLQEIEKIVDRYFDRDFIYFFERGELINFKKVFQFVALNLKNILKYETIATEFSISRYKIQKFIKFLEDSFLIWSVSPFFTDKSKEFSSHNKYYFVDNGILNYIRGNFNVSLDKGGIVENFVFTHLKRKYKEIYYYHKQKGGEIDFILSFFDENLEKKIIPIEVKAGDRLLIPKIFYSFYKKYYNLIDRFVVTTKNIKEKKMINNIEIVFDKFRYFWEDL